MNLEKKFQIIKEKGEKRLIIERVAKVCFSASTGRVFPKAQSKNEKSANDMIKEVLITIDVDNLLSIETEEAFKEWFKKNLDLVTDIIPTKNSHGENLSDGTRRWGYAAKILCLYLRDIVEHCRYFNPEQAQKARQWLYCPIDKKVMDKMRQCGENLSFKKIKEIDTEDLFYDVQKRLGEAADKVGVPRIWFDYVWSDPEGTKVLSRRNRSTKQSPPPAAGQ